MRRTEGGKLILRLLEKGVPKVGFRKGSPAGNSTQSKGTKRDRSNQSKNLGQGGGK